MNKALLGTLRSWCLAHRPPSLIFRPAAFRPSTSVLPPPSSPTSGPIFGSYLCNPWLKTLF